ncbi:hypothetical protein RKE29_20120 [Streptomyces sp. B1866]|uniref:hypothetical protein n=1 Tax=Streptomyces sp. B1866 TaxID=3075431 RepID=UPI00288F53BE|nr:hypothetical protein [Streptomyces sp. B1866]MDT3398923.1 hypothetical protein [Streptomyces sp. B1866]
MTARTGRAARTARRPLLTAAATGTLLCALWSVPSAHAATGAVEGTSMARGPAITVPGVAVPAEAGAGTGALTHAPYAPARDPRLADSGGVDVTPYLIGGTAFLGLGVAMVTVSVRRSRPEAY